MDRSLMTRESLLALLSELSKRRPVFHSEADFQHELAWLLRERNPSAEVRLERPFYLEAEAINLDILLRSGEERLGIELKYWKRGRELMVKDEPYKLKNQAAQDIARYDFCWDIGRLERLQRLGEIQRGFAIALASDAGYWNRGRPGTVDVAFRLHEGQTLTGVLAWSGAGPGTTRGREGPIVLADRYTLDWHDYSKPEHDYPLRALVVEVGSKGEAPRPEPTPARWREAERPRRRHWRDRFGRRPS